MREGEAAGTVPGGAGAAAPPGPPFSVAPERRPWWSTASGDVPLDRPVVMGILNLTPDSFSDGGDLAAPGDALERAEVMVAEGAQLLDLGGESTRPGAAEVPAEEEKRRVLPPLRELVRRLDVPISVDTRKAEVARAALGEGAAIVNDVSGLAYDPEMAEVVAGAGAGVVLMHMRGTPATMASLARYGDVVEEVARELEEAVGRARAAGVPDARVVLDPGIGFAKDTEQNLALLAGLPAIVRLGFPVLVGPSRKRFLGDILGKEPKERVHGTVGACLAAWERGARLFRVHDVAPVVDALAVAHRIGEGR